MITTYHEDNDYIATAKRLIKWLEEEGGAVKNDVYNDGVSNPTIAWGVNITVKKYLGYVLTEMGIKDTTSEVTDTTADGY